MLRVTDKAGAERIVGDAEWIPFTFDPSGSSLVFVLAPEDVRRDAPFLDGQAIGPLEKVLLPTNLVEDVAAGISTVPLHFVFHTALCGSTMLVRALEATKAIAGLREPAVLLNVYHRFANGAEAGEARRLDLTLKLLARPFAGRASVVIKPSCFVNPLIPLILARSPSSRAVLLHSDLRAFLLGVAKRGREGRNWARQVFANVSKAIPLELPIGAMTLRDLQEAGLAWLMRRWLFDRVSEDFGPRTMQIRSERLFADPAAVVGEICEFFGVEVSPDALLQPGESSVLEWHSKEAGRRFGSDDRTKELDKVRETHGNEVEAAASWVEALAAQQGIVLS